MHAVVDLVWHFLRIYGYPVIFVLLFIEECGIPLLFVPGDLLIMWAGYRYSIGRTDALVVLALGTAAVGMGSSVLFAVSSRWGPKVLTLAERFLHASPARVERAGRWVRRHGFWAIIAGRLIPGLRTPTSIVAGTLRVRYGTFLPGALVAAVLWTGFYFWLGAALGAAYDRIGVRTILQHYWRDQRSAVLLAGSVVILTAIAIAGWRRLRLGGKEVRKLGS